MMNSPFPVKFLSNRNVANNVSFRLRCPEVEFIHTEQDPDTAVLLDWCWESTAIPTTGIPDTPALIPDVSAVWYQWCVLDTYLTLTGMYRKEHTKETLRPFEQKHLREWLLNPTPETNSSPYTLKYAVRFCPIRAPLYYHLREYLPSVTTLGVIFP